MKKAMRDSLDHRLLPTIPTEPVEWHVEEGLTPYLKALAFMEERVVQIRNGQANELVWLVEHPPLYTAGTSASPDDLLNSTLLPVFEAGRGGEYTYHGPGQRVAYVMLDLKRRREDIRAFVSALEEWIIQALAILNIKGERREDRVGVWVIRPDLKPNTDGTPAEAKIAAIGVRIRKWVSYHGIAINVEPDLTHYSGIVPCGITDHGVTSLVDCGHPLTMTDFDMVMREAFETIFGPSKLV